MKNLDKKFYKKAIKFVDENTLEKVIKKLMNLIYLDVNENSKRYILEIQDQ